MRIVFLGTADFAVPPLRALVAAGHPVNLVISQPDRPAGRGRATHPTPVHAAADALQLPCLQPEDINSLSVAEVVTGAELGVCAAFGQKIGGQILSALPRGCLNIHASLLPKYRGAAPIQRALIEGAEETGVTVFQLNERWDAGAIWAQRSTVISDSETAGELHDRLADLGASLIVEMLPQLEGGTLRPIDQDPALATRAPKLSKAEGTVDWTQPAGRIIRRIHGLWSWPAAACIFVSRTGKEERVLLARAAVGDPTATPSPELPPGTFVPDLSVQTGAGRVKLLEVQPSGGKRMSFKDFANGRRVAPPDRLMPVKP